MLSLNHSIAIIKQMPLTNSPQSALHTIQMLSGNLKKPKYPFKTSSQTEKQGM